MVVLDSQIQLLFTTQMMDVDASNSIRHLGRAGQRSRRLLTKGVWIKRGNDVYTKTK